MGSARIVIKTACASLRFVRILQAPSGAFRIRGSAPLVEHTPRKHRQRVGLLPNQPPHHPLRRGGNERRRGCCFPDLPIWMSSSFSPRDSLPRPPAQRRVRRRVLATARTHDSPAALQRGELSAKTTPPTTRSAGPPSSSQKVAIGRARGRLRSSSRDSRGAARPCSEASANTHKMQRATHPPRPILRR